MHNILSSVIALAAISLVCSVSFGRDKACSDLHQAHKHTKEAIKHLEHHRDQGKRAAIIDALRAALRDIDAEKLNLGCK